MALSNDISNQFVGDLQNLGKLRFQAKTDPNKSLKDVAQQFETLFLDMMLKSMRDASQGNSLFDSEQSKMYTQLMDQQLSQKLASTHSIGLADMMIKQMTRNTEPAVDPASDGPKSFKLNKPEPQPMELHRQLQLKLPEGQHEAPFSLDRKNFVQSLMPHAADAGKKLGVPPQFLVGQAALESGWGKGEIKGSDGEPSHNLFGIKAGRNWNGPTVEALTTEYVDGKPMKKVEQFRAYGSYKEAFQDYAEILKGNSRYSDVLGTNEPAAFAQALQKGGYATDPLYATKLERVIASQTAQMPVLS